MACLRLMASSSRSSGTLWPRDSNHLSSAMDLSTGTETLLGSTQGRWSGQLSAARVRAQSPPAWHLGFPSAACCCSTTPGRRSGSLLKTSASWLSS